MLKKMLIDASHTEETRVALLDEKGALQDFEFKSSTKETVKGNIYLAKIARVEPSLQAAFVDYGGNRHGFLAFSEIHPDYFRIPVSDRESLKASFAEEQEEESLPEETLESSDESEKVEALEGEEDVFKMPLSTVGGDLPPVEDEEEELRPKSPPLHRRYKIQEVIHKNQILLVQVAKEERGGKGAALTTFLSLAGRYCVLMPNSPRSGGISRKITNPSDRKRLRDILESFNIPSGMGLIVRTAGKDRTRIELRRDAQYLMRLWDNIRSLTLKSVAPALVNREDNIIKRAIRDLYTKDVTEVLIEGEEGYKVAKDFMKTLMPSHSRRVQRFKREKIPLFHKYGVESQIDAMHDPEVRLPSGGSIVIHPTEALVSIDINSGKATKERHIEKTATKTNLEAAEEIARQVRLRDLAGLIVVDFIDMDEPRHISSVEKKVREAFRDDRARIQLGRISPFGLLEMSRQRLAPSILERSAHPCAHCKATGYVRSTESFALHVLRLVEEEGFTQKSKVVQAHAPADVILYLMNHKRDVLADIEERHDLRVTFEPTSTPLQTCSLVALEMKSAQESEAKKEETSGQKEAASQNKKEGGSSSKMSDKTTQGHKRGRGASQSKRKQPKKEASSGDKGGDDPASKSQQDNDKNRDASEKSSGSHDKDKVSPQEASSLTETSSSPNSEADSGKQESSSSQKKRRPRRRSKRLRRPHNEETADAAPAQSKSTTQGEGDKKTKPETGASQNKEGGGAPSKKRVAHEVIERTTHQETQASKRGPDQSNTKVTSDKDGSKSNWWRRLLD